MRRVALLALLLLAGCGGDETPPAAPAKAPSPRLVDFSKKPPFVNTLDIDPANGDFLLTTNKGFWRIASDGSKVTPIKGTITAEGKTDSVGTFLEIRSTGPNKLLGSGHPDTLGKLPNFLGLLRSTDGGKTWSAVSRLADADLHKIVLAHDRLYAFDAVLSAMLISSDGGKTFTEEFTPRGLMIDFEVDPANPERIISSTDTELFRTEDGGKSWRPLEGADGIRLAWPEPESLYRADKDGTIKASGNGGTTLDATSGGGRRALRMRATGPESAVPRVKRWIDHRDRRMEAPLARPVPALTAAAAALLVAAPAADAHSLIRLISGEGIYLSQDATSLNTLTVRMGGHEIEFHDPTVDGGIGSRSCRPGDVEPHRRPDPGVLPSVRVSRASVDLADREDTATVTAGLPTMSSGGSGADTITTGRRRRRVDGGDGNDRLITAAATTSSRRGRYRRDRRRRRRPTTSPPRTASRHGPCGDGVTAWRLTSLDDVAADCEAVTRTQTAAPPDHRDRGRTRPPPKVDASAVTLQRLGRRPSSASPRPRASAARRVSGFLDVPASRSRSSPRPSGSRSRAAVPNGDQARPRA